MPFATNIGDVILRDISYNTSYLFIYLNKSMMVEDNKGYFLCGLLLSRLVNTE